MTVVRRVLSRIVIGLMTLVGAGLLTPVQAWAQTPGPTPLPPPFDQMQQIAGQIFTPHSIDPVTMIGRLLLAAFLGAIIAFRRKLRVEEYILQAHVIISFTGAMMMIIIGNDMVRAFGLLGAGNIVRYRTPVRDPQALASLFVTMGVGIAVGVGLYEVAITAAILVVVFQVGFSHLTDLLPRSVYMPQRSYELQVTTDDPDVTLDMLRSIFHKEDITFSLLEYEQGRKDKPAKLGLKVVVPENMDTEYLTSLVLGPGVHGVRWEEG